MEDNESSFWRSVRVLLDEASNVPPEQRTAFLKASCAGDERLQHEVEALLEVQAEAEGYFEDLSDAFVAPASAALDDALLSGAVLEGRAGAEEVRAGAYRLVERIGGGGMGTVYRAERADGQFEQQVAVKVLRAEVASGDAHRRFLRERQILASLQHPHIARVFDGGVLDDGRPYLVMEYVEGRPLGRYCDEERLGVEERLGLLEQVCEAVQLAHRNLVVHRDLKSSNVLVTAKGHVKLVDFGIAKLLEEHPTDEEDEAPLTRDGQHWLTPECVAPEQLVGEPITTATDVYQLGLLAYRLLAGRPAFALDTQAPHEAMQVIVESCAVAPSMALGRGPQANVQANVTAEAAGRRRDTDLRALRSALRSALRADLDHIVLKALRREPERRYAAAEAFADDLRRYRRGLPVAARADTWTYRAGTFLRRHRFGAAVAALLVLLCTGYAASMAWQMRRTARERDKAQELATYMVDLFEVSAPNEAVGDAVSARDLLDRGVREARSAFEQHPATRAMLLTVTGNIYRRLGLYDEADPLLSEALAVRRRLYGSAHPDVAESLHALGRLRYEQGRYDAARPLLRKALAVRRHALGSEHPAVATTLRALGWLQQSTGHYAAADSLFTQALNMRRRLLGATHPDVAESLSDRAAVFRSQGRYREAERYYRKALRLHREAYGQTHLRVAEDLNNLAALLQNKGRYDRAEVYARQSLQRYRTLFSGTHPDVAVSLSNLAYIFQKKGEFAAADSLYREALAMRRRLFGEHHPHVANSLNNLAALLQDQGRYVEAEPLARRALAIYRTTYGNEHPQVAQALTTLAWLERNQGDLREAESRFREALRIRRHLYGKDHPRVAKNMSYLAELLHARGHKQEAEVLFRQALHRLNGSVSQNHPYRAIALTGLGDVLTDQARAPEGEPLLRQALALRSKGLPPGHWRTAKTQLALGHCLQQQQRYDEAQPLLKAAFEALRTTRGSEDPLTQRAWRCLEALPATLRPAGARP